MNPGTLIQILSDAADTLNLDPEYDRKEIVKRINRARRVLYFFENGREAFFKTEGPATSIAYPFSDGRRGNYIGLTLPPEIEKLDVLRYKGQSVTIYETHQADVAASCPSKAVHMGNQYVLQREPCEPKTFYFRIQDACDEDKKVGIYYDHGAGTKREDVVLTRDCLAKTSYPVKQLLGLTLPHDRSGVITIEQDDGTELGFYHPSVQPASVRYALHGFGAGQQFHYWATTKCADVQFDTDLVESENSMLWDNLLRYEQLQRKTNRTAGEERAFGSTQDFVQQAIEQAMKAQEADWQVLTLKPGSKRSFDSQLSVVKPPGALPRIGAYSAVGSCRPRTKSTCDGQSEW